MNYYPVPDTSVDRVLFSIDFFVSFFLCSYLCFFVSNITRKRLDRFAWNFQGRCWVTMGWPDSNFWVKSEKPRDAATLISFTSFVDITSKRLGRFAWNFQGRCGVTMGRCDSIFGQFGETTRCSDANFFVSNITSKQLNRFAWSFHGKCGVTTGWPDYIFGQFRETVRCATQGRGLLCFHTSAC